MKLIWLGLNFLAQNAIEKKYSIVGVTFFAAFMFFLFLDSQAKQKYIPKKGPVKKFVLLLFILAVIALGFLFAIYAE